MTYPPPEPHPLVAVCTARALVSTLGQRRRKPIWVLVLECGHEVRRVAWVAPEHVRCDACAELARVRAEAE